MSARDQAIWAVSQLPEAPKEDGSIAAIIDVVTPILLGGANRELTKSDAAFSALQRHHTAADVALIDTKAELARVRARWQEDDAAMSAAFAVLNNPAIAVAEAVIRARSLLLQSGKTLLDDTARTAHITVVAREIDHE